MHTPRSSDRPSDRTADRRRSSSMSTWFLGRPGHLYAERFPQRRRAGLDDQRTR
jgi:hypothetical protein